MKIVVGLAGGKRVGKDTTAGILIEKFKNVYPVHTIAFADPIKDMLKVLLNYTGMNDANFASLVNCNEKDTRLLPVGRFYLSNPGPNFGNRMGTRDDQRLIVGGCG